MKKLFLLSILVSGLCFGQFFETDDPNQENETSDNVFNQNQDDDQPDIEEDTGNPGDPAPIDGAWYLLPLAGMAVAVYYLKKQKKVVVFCNRGIQADKAIEILKKNGVENVVDGTSWKNVKALQDQNKLKKD